MCNQQNYLKHFLVLAMLYEMLFSIVAYGLG